jgi:hypothetical protein
VLSSRAPFSPRYQPWSASFFYRIAIHRASENALYRKEQSAKRSTASRLTDTPFGPFTADVGPRIDLAQPSAVLDNSNYEDFREDARETFFPNRPLGFDF